MYIISDTHFSVLYEDKVSSIERTEEIFKKWNDIIKKDDFVIFLGDIYWDNIEYFDYSTMCNLNGNKILVIGNHDYMFSPILWNGSAIKIWCAIYPYGIWVHKLKYAFTHYPMITIPRNYINFHGHTHKDIPKTQQHIPCCVNEYQDIIEIEPKICGIVPFTEKDFKKYCESKEEIGIDI